MHGGLIARTIERPVSVLVGVILVLLFGALSLLDLPIQLTPDVAIPTISISTAWRGAAPTEIETDVLEEQEEALKSLPGLERMTSSASSDSGEVTLEFAVGTPMEETLVRVANRLAQVSDYPLNVEQPVVSTSGSTGPPLAVVVVHSRTGTPVGHYRTWVEDHVITVLERIKGVASIRLIGGQQREVQIEFDPAALAGRGLTVGQVAQVLRGELRDVSAGDITLGKRRYVVRTPVGPAKPEDLEQVVLKTSADGSATRLRDVATVRLAFHKSLAEAFANGEPSMALLFFREAGSNVLAVTEEIKRTVAELQQRRLGPEGLEIQLVSDQTEYINGSLDLVWKNLLVGGVLAMLVLLLFLRSFTAAALVSIAIPVCMVGTALGMALVGRTVNVVSLAGMAFAVGMVVDNAIVVLENIHSARYRDLTAPQAALAATHEVWGAILASTLTTAVVFLPIIGWRDEVGELLRDVAVALTVAVFISLIVSVLVIPSFSARLLRRRAPVAGSSLVSLGERFRTRVGAQVRWIVGSGRRSLLLTLVALGGAVAVALALLPPMDYLPTGNRNMVFGILLPPPGYSVEEMARIGRQVQARLVEHKGVDKGGVPALERFFYVGLREQAFMGVKAVDAERAGELVPFMRALQAEVPGVIGIATRASLFGRRIGGGRAIEIEISGADLGQLVAVGGPMMGAVRKVLPTAQARPIPSLEVGAPELHAIPRRQELARLGLTGAELGLVIDALIDGAKIGELSRKAETKLDVMLVGKGGEVYSPQGIAAAPVATPSGQVVTLGTVAEIVERLGPTVIQRIERRRAIIIQVAPPPEIPLEQAMSRLRRDVVAPLKRAGKVPEGVRIELSGTAGQLDKAKARLGAVLALAVLISFLLLAGLFEDFLAPIAVLVTLPLAAAGGVLGLRLVDGLIAPQPLDMMTSVGFVILIGVVVNNAILVVHGALACLREGEPLAEALAEGVRRRVRPIFMSALTSLAGLLPLVLATGFGSELYRGVGAIVLGGLALSTVLTLYVVPAVFSMLWRLSRRAA